MLVDTTQFKNKSKQVKKKKKKERKWKKNDKENLKKETRFSNFCNERCCDLRSNFGYLTGQTRSLLFLFDPNGQKWSLTD